MALLTAIVPTAAGTVVPAPSAVSSSDTIAAASFGRNGVNLKVINAGAGVDTITISDSGATPAGTTPGTYTVTVTNGTSKAFAISALAVNPNTGVVTVTHSLTAGVTCELYSEDD